MKACASARTGLVALTFLVLLTFDSQALGARDIPFLAGRVNDTANILKPETIAYLEGILEEHEAQTTNQVVVLTIDSLRGDPLEEYSMRVVEGWKIGERDRDNGVLLLVARDDRKVRIEVGYGLEGALPDVTAKHILDYEILPRFRSGNFDQGVRAGTEAILESIQGEYHVDPTASEPARPSSEANGISDYVSIFFGALVFVAVSAFALGLYLNFLKVALFNEGGFGWFMFVILIPFLGVPGLMIAGFIGGVGRSPGFIALGGFVVVVLALVILRVYLHSERGADFRERLDEIIKHRWLAWAISSRGGSSSGGSSSYSHSGGSSYSSSGFSGGGGSFGGGGASGSW